jgi:hypothetical protein
MTQLVGGAAPSRRAGPQYPHAVVRAAARVCPRGRRTGREPPRIVAYRAVNMVQVTVDTVARMGGIIDTAIGSGANRVANIGSSCATARGAPRGVAGDAQRAARGGGGGGSRRRAARSRAEHQHRRLRRRRRRCRTRAAGDDGHGRMATPIEGGTLTVTATVNVVYRLARTTMSGRAAAGADGAGCADPRCAAARTPSPSSRMAGGAAPGRMAACAAGRSSRRRRPRGRHHVRPRHHRRGARHRRASGSTRTRRPRRCARSGPQTRTDFGRAERRCAASSSRWTRSACGPAARSAVGPAARAHSAAGDDATDLLLLEDAYVLTLDDAAPAALSVAVHATAASRPVGDPPRAARAVPGAHPDQLPRPHRHARPGERAPAPGPARAEGRAGGADLHDWRGRGGSTPRSTSSARPPAPTPARRSARHWPRHCSAAPRASAPTA